MELEWKYSPSMLHVLVAGRLFLEEEMKDKMAAGSEVPMGEFRIFIRDLEDNSRCYQIAYEPDGQAYIWEGSWSGTVWRKMQDSMLSENKDKLGEVVIKRNHLSIKEYRTYDEFWNDIRLD